MPGRSAPFAAPYRRRRGSAAASVLPIPAAPSTPTIGSPANGSVASYSRLTWTAAGATTVDLYLGTSASPPLLIPFYVGTSYTPTLLPGTRYYWQIVARNAGGTAAGPIWSFTTPAATAVLFTLGGVDITARVRWPSLQIHDALHAAPNTASLELLGTVPPLVGQAIAIGLGSLDAANLLFGGTVQDVGQSYIDTPTGFPVWPLTLVDYTFTINKRRPIGTYVNKPADLVAIDMVARSAPGFTTNHVQAGLPAVSITFDGQSDFMTCLGQLATAISTLAVNGVADVDYSQDVHLFLTEPDAVAPDPIDAAHPPLNDPPLAFSTDMSQIRTTVYGKGNSQTVPTDVLAGETILPVADAALFTVGGGQAVAGTSDGGAQSQKLTYSDVQLGGGGSLVGPGAAPSTAPSLAPASGVGLGAGWYGYAVVDRTAAGPSLPGPVGTIQTTGALTPPAAVTASLQSPAAGGMDAGAQDYVVTFVTAAGESLPGTASNSVTTTPTVSFTQIANVPLGPTGTTGRKVYRRFNGAGTYKLQRTVNDNTQTGPFGDGTPNASLGAAAPSVDTTVLQQVTVTGIALGASPTTSREVYRTAVQATQAAALTAQLKLLTTLADNTSTGPYADSTADGSLGANAPIADTSGISFAGGQVNPGSIACLTASPAPFQTGGGWAILGGGQVVRYTGISGNTLTGIPVSGPGSITTTVLYGSQVLPSPALVGINHWNGLPLAMAKGASVAIWVQRDDLAAQAALALLEGVGGDGIREYTIVDGRRNEASLIAVCDADLAIFSRPQIGVTYTTRDRKSKSGRPVVIDVTLGHFDPATFDPVTFDVVTVWGLAGTFTIVDVTISFDGPALMPWYAVKAASTNFTLAALLQRVVLAA